MVNRNINFMIIVFTFFLIIQGVFADGCFFMHPDDEDMWQLSPEKQQYSIISYDNGIQNMILSISIDENATGAGVWIFPVPANPENVSINILNSFPQLLGDDVIKTAKREVNLMSESMLATQVYPLFLRGLYRAQDMNNFENTKSFRLDDSIQGVTVYETIEAYGVSSELISAVDKDNFINYLNSKNLTIENEISFIIQDYIGQNYSFVISWIDDIEELKKNQNPIGYIRNLVQENKVNEARHFLNKSYSENLIEEYLYEDILDWLEKEDKEDILRYLSGYDENTMGVFISFPTDKIFFPLKLTSIYGDLEVPALVYVLDYVTPDLFDEIKDYSSVEYYYDSYHRIEDKDRFFYEDNELVNKLGKYWEIEGLKYTKVKINAQSKNFIDDLWFEKKIPTKVKFATYITKEQFSFGILILLLILLGIISCISSLISGFLFFRKEEKFSKIKFFFLGLFNYLSILILAIAMYFFRTKKVDIDRKNILNSIESYSMKKKKYLEYASVYLILVFVSAISVIVFDIGVAEILIFLGILLGVFCVFKLSIEKVIDVKLKDYRVIDIKKFVYLISLFFIFWGIAFFIETSSLDFILMDLDIYSYDYFPFLFFVIFAIGIVFLIPLDEFLKKKFAGKGFWVVKKDIRKLWYLIVFSIIFVFLVLMLKYLFIFILT